jgi:hypothetical protein
VNPFPEGLLVWLRLFVRNSFLRELDDKEAEEVMEEVATICEVDCKNGEGDWELLYMRLRFSAILAGPSKAPKGFLNRN